MKVLMFGWEFPPHNSGGLGVACRGLAKALVDSGVDLNFVLPKQVDLGETPCKMWFADSTPNPSPGSVEVNQLNVLLMPYITSQVYSRYREQLPEMPEEDIPYAGSLYEEVKRYGKLARKVAHRADHDIIHAHDWLSFEAGVEAKRVSGKPLVVHIHATEFDRSGEDVNQCIYDIERKAFHAADRVVAVSNLTKRVLMDRYGVSADKISVVHNGVNEEEYSSVESEQLPESLDRLKRSGYKIVLFAGRITFQKGPDYFVKMAQRVKEYCPEAVFVVSGSGDMEHQMMREVAEHQLSDRFLFAGWLTGKPLRMAYKAADIYIMPSVSEPFGILPLEVMVYNTPVLISKQSGVSEITSHTLKADFWDVDDMANKVIYVLKYPALQHCLTSNGRQEVGKINWSLAGRKCVDIYRQLQCS